MATDLAARQATSAGIETSNEEVESAISTAPVQVDGVTLFSVRGVMAGYSAKERAEKIGERIQSLGGDRSFGSQNIQLKESLGGTEILGGNKLIMIVTDADARLQGTNRQYVAQAYATRMVEAVEAYRRDRQPKNLVLRSVYAAIAIGLFVLTLWAGNVIVRRIGQALELRYREKLKNLAPLQVVEERHVSLFFTNLIRTAWGVIALVAAYLCLSYSLALFPWTRGLAMGLYDFVINPVRTMAAALLKAIPDMIFLAVLIALTAYTLKVIRLFFDAVERGTIPLANFEPEWAKPTHRLVRGLIVAFAMVAAYPYIPGSHTEAFKGISLLVGLIISLGSTSLIGNMISGYSLAYRRQFRKGDRVKIGEFVGDVEDSKAMVTYLRTNKNEMVAVPNSKIINEELVNYSALARSHGLILHTTVGIGYETPWRQVEAMLIEAAERTPGLLRDPKPFVLQTKLGSFDVTYEINVYCDDPSAMAQRYADLHRNILDAFNEYGVQIMTPAYESDPEDVKVVPKSKWFAAPADKEKEAAGAG